MSNLNAGVADHHIDALDGLRGFAVLYVMLSHLFPYYVFDHLTFLNPLFVVLEMGWTGVDLFFVLSGFLITSILLRHKSADTYFKAFYARRTLRIFPLYYLALTIFLVFIPYLDLFPQYNNFMSQGSTWQYWAFLVNIGPETGMAAHAFLSVAWSLAIEEQYYLVWPWVVRSVSNRSLQWVCLAGLLMCSSLRVVMYFVFSESPQWLYHFTFTHLDGILLGSLLATLFAERSKYGNILRRYSSSASTLLIACVAITCWSILLPNNKGNLSYQLPMVILGYLFVPLFYGAVLTRCLLKPGKLSGIFNASWLRSCGKYSYCMYLVHFIFSGMVLSAFRFFDPGMFPGQQIVFGLSALVLTLLFTYLFAYLSWQFFEGPFNALKKHFVYK